jgi:hypothetical protein
MHRRQSYAQMRKMVNYLLAEVDSRCIYRKNPPTLQIASRGLEYSIGSETREYPL